jgi:hypothetical protein
VETCRSNQVDAPLSRIFFQARLLTPKDAEDRPELLWADFRRMLPELIAVIEAERGPAGDGFVEIDVEFLPDELPTILQALPAPSSAGETALS